MGFPRNTPAPANFVDWKKENGVFSDMAALADRGLNLTGDGNPEKLDGYATSWNVFTILGVKPMLGRTFLPEEDDPAARKSYSSVTGYGCDGLVVTRRWSAVISGSTTRSIG